MIKEYFLIKDNKIKDICLIPDEKLEQVISNGYIVIERVFHKIPLKRLIYQDGQIIVLPDLQKEQDELNKFLNDTDWYISRFTETGVEIPQEIKDKRQQARDRISEIRIELGE